MKVSVLPADDLSKFIVTISGFINPPSTSILANLQTKITAGTPASSLIDGDTYTNTALSDITPDYLQAATIAPSSQQIGGTGLVTISFKTKGPFYTSDTAYVYFPYWNPSVPAFQSSLYKHQIMTTNPGCTALSANINTGFSCTYDNTKNLLTIISMVSSTQAGGSTFQIQIGSFRNPYSEAPRTGYQIYFTDSSGGQKESTLNSGITLSFSISTWATFDSATIGRSDGIKTVGEQSEGIGYFASTLPTDQYCRLKVTFPTDMPVTTAMAQYLATGILAKSPYSTITQVSTTSNFIYIDGCSSYTDASSATFYMKTMVNKGYVAATVTFSFELYALPSAGSSTMYKQLKYDTNLILGANQFSKGTISSLVITAVQSNVIQDSTQYTITIRPQHSMPTDSKIIITFPSTITLPTDNACTLTFTTSISTPTACTVNPVNNKITLTNPFGAGTYAATSNIKFTLSTMGTNPTAAMDVGSFQVQTKATIGVTDYDIDDRIFLSSIYTVVAATMTASVFQVSSYQTSASPTTYTLQLNPNKQVPANGIIKVQFPPEITLVSGASSVTSCAYKKAAGFVTSAGVTMTATSPPTLTISDAFTGAAYTGSFQVQCSGFTNPRTTALTSTFQVSTTDSSSRAIESAITGITTQMTTVPNLVTFAVSPSSTITGSTANYQISATSSIATNNGESMLFTFPTEISLPASPSCTVVSSITTLTCTVAGTNRLKVTYNSLSPNPLPAGTSLAFTVNNLKNPYSTQPTSAFSSILVQDASNNQISQYTGSVTVTMTTPASSPTYSLAQASQASGAQTDYTITYTNVNTMPSGSTFLITYPSTVTVPSSLTSCLVSLNGVQYTMTGCTVNTATRTIKVQGVFNTAVTSSGQQIKVTLGKITNPTSAVNPQTFTITSFTDTSFAYSMDQVINNLIPSYLCTYPCATCDTTVKTKCYSCFSTTATVPEKYFYQNQCLAACPAGMYADSAYQCQDCPTQCKTCSNARTCTSCSILGNYPYLFNGWCYSSCPSGYYQDSNQCVQCNTNCKTCQGSATKCTSCNTGGLTPFLSYGQCLISCPAGFYSNNFNCYKCNSPCANCLVSPNSCTSCLSGFLYGTNCVGTCPVGTAMQGQKCAGCDPKCAQCSPSELTRCMLCLPGFYLLNNTCFTACPDSYRIDNTTTSCEIVPPVVEPNNTNNIQKPNTTDLFEYQTQNSSAYVYYPTTISQTILGGVSVGSYFKDPSSMVHSNAIAMWGPLETLSYGAQIYLSYDALKRVQKVPLNYSDDSNGTTNATGRMLEVEFLTSIQNNIVPLIFYGTGFSLLAKVILNIISGFIYIIIIKRDNGYQDYHSQYKCFALTLVFFGSVISFKLHKLFYSRFFGLERFFIPLEHPEKMHRAYNVLTILNLVLSLIPMIIVDIYGIIKYKWGDQFFIMITETLILSISMIVLTLLEFRAMKNQRPYNEAMLYSAVKDQPNMDEEVMRRLEEEIKKKFGGLSMEEFIEKLKRERGEDTERVVYVDRPGAGFQRGKSMIDMGERDKEEDDRRMQTEPLNPKDLQRDLQFERKPKEEFPDNVIAEVGPGKKTPGNGQEFVQQTVKNLAEERKDARTYGRVQEGDDGETPMNKKKKGMRGRKGKYYSQVDDEDQSFLEQERAIMDEDDEDDDKLHMIEEEASVDQDLGETMRRQDDVGAKLMQSPTSIKDLKASPDKLDDSQRQPLNQNDDESNFFEVENAVGEGAFLQDGFENNAGGLNQKAPPVIQDDDRDSEEDDVLDDGSVPMNQLMQQVQEEEEARRREEEARRIKEQADKDERDRLEKLRLEEALREQERQERAEQLRKQQEEAAAAEAKAKQEEQARKEAEAAAAKAAEDAKNQMDIDGTYPKFKSTEDMRKEIEREIKDKKYKDVDEEQIIKESEHEEEKGMSDSDDDEEQRLKNMRDPEKKKFNVNDILGEFDRDDRGNPQILQNQEGEYVDKDGSRVNEKGYLIDEKTGDVVEKERKRKIFDFAELDERGELPPPFNLERFNFNPHDVRGYFDRDSDGNEIIGNKKDKNGNLIDKLGRRVNEHGYLIDAQGNLVDKRGRIKLHKNILDQSDGEIPQLFNYKGKKFDIQDVMGALDKDRNGNFIIRRDKHNQMVDKKGRRVNARGYLIDQDGNVINDEGKIMFENFTLSPEGEIPKLFPFLKFNIEDIKGDYEVDPLGIPMLTKSAQGFYTDAKGRRVNEKGYLLDENGNIVNKKRKRVFNKYLLEDDGDIPKIFRTGLLRKDTYDSFSQLMSEIEDLERLQEMDEEDPKLQAKIRDRMKKENDRLQKKIDKIVEEDNDDDDMLMKELEDLANEDNISDGGNTSVDSQMEDTPSNYNALNQRFNEVEDIKNKAKRNMRMQQQLPEEEEEYSEYSYMPDKKMKKKKKKKKKKVKKEPTIDERELMMARAYGGLSQQQYDKLVQMKKMQVSQMGSRPTAGGLPVTGGNIVRNASNTLMTSMQARKGAGKPSGMDLDTVSRFNDDGGTSEWGGKSQLESNTAKVYPQAKRVGGGFVAPPGEFTQRPAPSKDMLKNSSRQSLNNQRVDQPKRLVKNNLMGSTQQSFMQPDQNSADDGALDSHRYQQQQQRNNQFQNQQDRRLSNVVNSVTGFYQGGAVSDNQSNFSRTQDNFASNIMGLGGKQPNPEKEKRRMLKAAMQENPDLDPELQRIYGTARGGLADMNVMSDWEKDSQQSGKSALSQYTQVNNTLKVKGLESIYLQRLEPASKGRKTAMRKGEDKAKFRVMHHKYHDEPEWYVDENRDELDSIISGNYKEMQKRFEEEFQGSSQKSKKQKRGKDGINIFTGNLKNYKEKQYQANMQSVDLTS